MKLPSVEDVAIFCMILGIFTIIVVGYFVSLAHPTCKVSGSLSINNPHTFTYYDGGTKLVPEVYGNGSFSYEGPCSVLETLSNNRLVEIN